MNILNIPSNYNFLKTICDFAIKTAKDNLSLSKITILLPSRRSCNELKRIFLEQSANEAIILPNIKAIGDIDYDDLLLRQVNSEDLKEFDNFSNNTSRIKYKILLIKELLKWSKLSNRELFENLNIEQATNLALELEKFLNEVNKNGLNLDNLETIVDEEYSKHWQEVLNFLEIFGKKWNEFIKLNNIISISDFKTKMIEFNAKFFEQNKPNNPIIIAGINTNVKSTCCLIKNIIKHDNCFFIFKGLDNILNEKEWKQIDVFHPQYSLKYLLENCICIDRKQIKNLEVEKNLVINKEFNIISTYSMLPNEETYKWQDKLNLDEKTFEHITKIECKENFEELSIISYILKYKTEIENKTMAVITSDENFANKLEIRLKNLHLEVNNAFGNKISQTEVVKFLFLILDVIKSNFESVALLSLLKHNFSFFDYTKEELNNLILLLEDKVLRGSGNLGLEGINKKIKELDTLKREELTNFIEKIKEFLKPLINFNNIQFHNILKFHVELAEKIASNNDIKGSDVFWNNEKNGNELLNFFDEIIKESESYGNIESLDEYSYLLDYLIAENSYSDKYVIHPMINIVSPQEAKLINYDLIIIADLNDGKFPIHIPTDPWMSKSMRKSFKLPQKEELIGNYAYDFVQYLNNAEVILIRSLKEDGVPTIKSKFLMRLETFLLCQNNLKIKENSIWKDVFEENNKISTTKIILRPKPTPPLEKRPKELFATKIEKLINNPYDIYSESILKLRKKDNFYEDKVFAFFGSAVHESIENYVKNYNIPKYVENKLEYLYKQLIEYGKIAFNKYFTNEVTKELFFIRFTNIAKWFIEQDEKIRDAGFNIFAERIEKYKLKNIDFTLSAKIDRIEENEFGIVNISDYKTGISPSDKDVLTGKKPQLTIEAIILQNKYKDKKIEKLVYWSIKGKGEDIIKEIKAEPQDLIEKGTESIKKLIAYFKIYENSYIATCYDLNDINHNPSDYKHLSRVDEWGYL